MKESPILFSGAMVRAILGGSKTQTRRIVKWKPREPGINLQASSLRLGHYFTGKPESGYVLRSTGGPCSTDRTYPALCPYGAPGDLLWCRETWIEGFPTGEPNRWSCLRPSDFRDPNGKAFYRADGEDDPDGPQRNWRPSIHMPRWASRITLEVTGVGVERLQDISEADAKAEGISEPAPVHGKWCDPKLGREGHWSYRKPYADLWESINGKGSWAENPFVWVIQFSRLDSPAASLAGGPSQPEVRL